MPSVQVLAPSGRRVRVSYPAGYTVSSVTGSAGFFGPSFRQRFTVGGPGFGAGYRPLAFGDSGRLVDRVVFDGRELRIWAPTSGAASSMATWYGPHHEICMGGPGVMTRQSALRAFDHLAIDDQPDGISLAPAATASVVREGSNVIVILDRQVGVVVPEISLARRLRPASAGTATRTGEVWRFSKVMDDKDPGERATRDYSYFVGTPRGFAQVNFMDGFTRGDDALLDFLDRLDVTWV